MPCGRPRTLSIRASIQRPDAKLRYNEGLFTRVAKDYDLATCAMSLGRDRVWKRRLVDLLPLLAVPRCIDLACGTGDLTLELARKYPDGDIVGVDLTPAMVEVARRRAAQARVRFRTGDMCRMDFPDGWADIITGSYALRNAPVLDNVLREVHRVLKPGGHAAFLDFAKSPIRWRQSLQLPLLKAWGGLWGILIHGAPEHAYIAESLRQFPDRGEIRILLSNAGFELLGSRNYFGGLLEALYLQRR